jgi:hypothetical protein
VRMAVGAIACWGIFVLAGLLVGGAVIFRAAVTLSNRFLGASPATETDSDDEELDEWIGYRQIKRRLQAIPEPGVGKGILCVLLLAVVGFLTGLLMRFLFGVGPFDDDGFRDGSLVLLSHVFGFVIGFPFLAWILASILPTKFGRACLVLLLSCTILLLIVGGLLGIIYAVS